VLTRAAPSGPFSSDLRRDLSIIRTVEAVQVLIAVIAVICYVRMHRSSLQGYGPVKKLFTFKVIVIIEAVQSTVFTYCSAHFVWRPTPRVSYRDLQVGLPNMLVCLEMLVAAIFFLWSFSAALYQQHARRFPDEKLTGIRGVIRGVVKVCNILDLVWGLWWALSARTPSRFRKGVVHESHGDSGGDGATSSSSAEAAVIPVKGQL
jgi:hypothetical protein